MKISVPRERKQGERRVALTPDGAEELVKLGHSVFVETKAGSLSGYEDSEYRAAGATVLDNLSDIWAEAEILIKVKEPAPEEIPHFRKGLTVFSFLHLAVAPELTRAMVNSGVTGIDYDLVMLDDGRLPILEPMSIIAGKLSIQAGANSLEASKGGRGILLGGAPGVGAAKVVVLGAGAAGGAAAKVAIGVGADVTVFDVNTARLAALADPPYYARTLYSTQAAINRELETADLIIGAVLIPGALAPKLITKAVLPKLKPGAVIVDICIDQGGAAESSRPTSIAEPTFVESGVVHYCVPNMPALVPRTSTQALTNASFPWLKKLATRGVLNALRENPPILRSLTSHEGHLTNEIIGKAVGMQSISSADLLR